MTVFCMAKRRKKINSLDYIKLPKVDLDPDMKRGIFIILIFLKLLELIFMFVDPDRIEQTFLKIFAIEFTTLIIVFTLLKVL